MYRHALRLAVAVAVVLSGCAPELDRLCVDLLSARCECGLSSICDRDEAREACEGGGSWTEEDQELLICLIEHTEAECAETPDCP